MKKHNKKMIAPIIIGVCVVLYYVGVAALLATVDGIPAIAQIIMVVVPLLLTGVMIGVLISRIKEIRSGEEDDLSKY